MLGASLSMLPALAAAADQSVAAARPAADARPAAAAPSAAADEVDQDLLEFLGSVDTQTDDSSWFEFLRSTDIGKLAAKKPRPALPREKK